jgi:hypothetical protein
MTEEIHLSITEPIDAHHSVLKLFAILAYPSVSEKEKRSPFVEALHAVVHKAPVWALRADNRHDSVKFRKLVPKDCRRRTNRKYQGLLNLGMGRIDKRLTAANIAARVCFSGSPSVDGCGF